MGACCRYRQVGLPQTRWSGSQAGQLRNRTCTMLTVGLQLTQHNGAPPKESRGSALRVLIHAAKTDRKGSYSAFLSSRWGGGEVKSIPWRDKALAVGGKTLHGRGFTEVLLPVAEGR